MRKLPLILAVLLASTISLAELHTGLNAAAAAVATQGAALNSAPVVQDGLSAVVRLPKAAIAANEDLNFIIAVKNTTDKGLLLHDVSYFWEWQVSLKDLKTGETWSIRPLFEAKRMYTDTFLDPGKSVELKAEFNLASGRFDFTTHKNGKIESSRTLPPGKYTLQVNIHVNHVVTQQSEYQPWKGVIKTGTLGLEITEPVK